MRVPSKFPFGNLYKKIEELVTDVGRHLETIARVVNGQVGFGDGTDPDNLKGVWKTLAFSATPGTELAVTHDLGQVPPGFLLMVPTVTGVINRTATPWTETQIFLSCTEASETAVIFILAPSQGF